MLTVGNGSLKFSVVAPLLLLSVALVQADTGDHQCTGADVVSISRPYFPDSPGLGTFKYSFRILRKADPGAPTVIYLPGGPGDTSMENGIYTDSVASMPAGFGIILTDPRSVGCNATTESFPQSAIRSEFLASDVIEIVRSQSLDRYYLHGVSYGTLLATVTAGLIEGKKTRAPEAIVLEGVLGRAFAPGEVFQGAIDQWHGLKARLAADVATVLDSDPPPLGLSGTDWGAAIPELLMLGTAPGKKEAAAQILSLLGTAVPQAAKDGLKGVIQQMDAGIRNPDPTKDHLYKAISCHEIATEVNDSSEDIVFALQSGELVATPGQLCDGIAMDRPFDAARWRTSAPIYYFEGSWDPSTPMNQALYHLASQGQAKRTFVKVIGGSHVALNNNLSDCTQPIWAAIANGGHNMQNALKGCALSTEYLSTP